MCRILLIFLSFLGTHACQPANKVNPGPSEVTVYEGDSYDLICSQNDVSSIKGCFLTTPKDDIYGFWKGANWENGRIKTVIEPNECKARIQNATTDDEGIWKCDVSAQVTELVPVWCNVCRHNTTVSATKKIRVTVLKHPPSIQVIFS